MRANSIIHIYGKPFEKSLREKIDSLVATEVFKFVIYDYEKYANIRIFHTRLVYTVKGIKIKLYEKLRLMVYKF